MTMATKNRPLKQQNGTSEVTKTAGLSTYAEDLHVWFYPECENQKPQTYPCDKIARFGMCDCRRDQKIVLRFLLQVEALSETDDHLRRRFRPLLMDVLQERRHKVGGEVKDHGAFFTTKFDRFAVV